MELSRTARVSALSLAIFAASLVADRAAAQTKDQCVDAFEAGQTHRKRLELKAARARFASCARDSCPSMVHADCAEQLAQVERDLPSIVLGAADENGRDVVDATIQVDGQPVAAEMGGSLPIDPGSHVVRFTHPKYQPFEERFVARIGERNRRVIATFAPIASAATGGEKQQATTAPHREPPSSGTRTLGYALTAGGAALFGVGLVFGTSTAIECGGVFKRPCDSLTEVEGNEREARRDSLDRRAWISNIALGVGAVAAGVGIVLLVKHRTPATANASLGLRVVPRDRGGALSLDGSF